MEERTVVPRAPLYTPRIGIPQVTSSDFSFSMRSKLWL